MKDNRKLKWILDRKFPFGNEKGKKIIWTAQKNLAMQQRSKGNFLLEEKENKKRKKIINDEAALLLNS